MKRIEITPRVNWQDKVSRQGLTYHTGPDGLPYWCEFAYYEFMSEEIDAVYDATVELFDRCLDAVGYVIEGNLMGQIGIPPHAHDAIRNSWQKRERSLYGRFDLAYNGIDPPKMLEFNADTPTSLVECAVAQWYWLQDRYPQSDQFNTIWEELVAAWKSMAADGAIKGSTVYFATCQSMEDWMTITMLQETAHEAGLITQAIHMEDIGWDTAKHAFVDLQNRRIQTIFKLYPWEWLLKDDFGANALSTMDSTQWIEPIWKFVLSCKGILPILWELFPDHPNLLPCYSDGPRELRRYVTKPVISREGANVSIHTPNGVTETPGLYSSYPRIYQQLYDLPVFDGGHPVLGSWVVAGKACGLGIRGSRGLVTDDLSVYVPHLFNHSG